MMGIREKCVTPVFELRRMKLRGFRKNSRRCKKGGFPSEAAQDRRAELEDILRGLLNSKDFVFRK